MSDAGAPTRVLVIEDHRLVAQGLELLLASEPSLEVAAIATTGAEGIELAAELLPDVAVIDYRLEDATGAQVARAIRSRAPYVRTLILSMSIGRVQLLEAVRAGARGYLLKSQAAGELLEAVRRVAAGEMLIPASQLAELLQEDAEGPLEDLTPRERELLGLLREGLDNRAIADRLGIRYVTVRGHLRNLLQKLHVHSRLEAVARAAELGILPR